MMHSSQVRPAKGLAAIALSAVLACGCLVPVGSAEAVTAAEKAAEAESALTQLNAMQQTLDEASSTYLNALAAYQQAVETRDATSERIEEINGEIEEIQERLGVRAREMYRNGATSFVDLLLGAASFDEFTQNWDLLNRVNETDADLSIKSKELRAEAEEQERILTEQAKVAEEKSDAAAEAYKNAEVLVEQMQQTFDALSAEAQELYYAEQAAAYGGGGGYLNSDGTVTDMATGQVYASPAEYSAVTGNAVVDRAMAWVGKGGYSWGGTGANGYFDCSGFVSYAITGNYNRLGNTYTFLGYTQVTDPQPGDICVNADHCGIYIGNNQMVHAADEASGIVTGKVQSGMIYVRPNY